MRLATKILLMMLLITVGTSAAVAWIVTLNVRAYETRRANDKVTEAIARYVTQLDDRHRQVSRIVRALLEAPLPRSQLQAADEAGDPAAREQLRQEILGRTVQQELDAPGGEPAFHVVVNLAGEVVVVVATAPPDPALEQVLAAPQRQWPTVEQVGEQGNYYVPTPSGLFLAMGVPLRTQLSEPPTHAYFIGFRVDDEWVRRQLVSGRRLAAGSADAPLSAWFVVDHAVVARASADPDDMRVSHFDAGTPFRRVGTRTLATSRANAALDLIEFDLDGERYLGHSMDLRLTETADARMVLAGSPRRLVLASSLDQALVPLRRLQTQILLFTIVALALAVLACRSIAARIAGPITELLAGTERVAGGRFDEPVKVVRADELGLLARAFNVMSTGLKERDALREQRTKTERDLAVARKIQMDVLPKTIPPCPGYDLAAFSLPAEQTGGDIYDLVTLTPDGTDGANPAAAGPGGDGGTAADICSLPGEGPPPLVVLLADAAGHGMGPALSVTQVRAMFRIGVRLRAGLSSVFDQINCQLCEDFGAERFVTAFLGVLDPAGHCVNYRSAGQAPLLHWRASDGRLTWLDSSMMPLGIVENPPDEGVQRVMLEPGDVFVLLTDGFYEFPNPAGQHFGRHRVGEVIAAQRDQPAGVILSALLAATRAFGGGGAQVDDMTALIIKRQPAGHPPDAGEAPAGRSSTIGAPSLDVRAPRASDEPLPSRAAAPAMT